MSLDSTPTATANSRLPNPKAGFADKLYRLDGGRSLANDDPFGPPAKMSDGASNSRRPAG